MITIIKGNDKKRCSQNTYETMYKRLGYEIFVEKPTKITVVEPEKAEKIVEKAIKKIETTNKKTKSVKTTKSKKKKGE